MKTRKLQQVGGGTFTVSIPKEWAAAQDFEAGDEVYLDPHSDGTLVIENGAEAGDRLGSCEIELETSDAGFAATVLENAYRTGYESVTVSLEDELDSAARQRLETCTTELLGMEIVEVADTAVTARCLLDGTDVSVRQSLVQLEFVTMQTLEAMAGALGGDAEGAGVGHRRREADRTVAMLEREFNRSLITIGSIDGLNVDRVQLYRYLVTAKQLAAITDIATQVVAIVENHPIEDQAALPIDLDALCGQSRLAVELAVEALMGDAPTETGRKVHEIYDEVSDTIETTTYEELQSAGVDGHKILRVLDRLSELAYACVLIADTGMRS